MGFETAPIHFRKGGAVKMRRAYWLSALTLAIGLIAARGGAEVAKSAGTLPHAERPSIVLVLTDDQRWDTLWGMQTVVEALAAHGVTFTNSFVTNPLCCPSRASLLTGRYSHSTGVYLNAPPHGGFRSFRDTTTIATVLHAAGYTTGLFGKYLNGYGAQPSDALYTPPGWDYWTAFLGNTTYYDYRLVEQGLVTQYGRRASDYSTDVLARKAASFVASAPRPFFLALAPFAPHTPATPPRRYARTFALFPWWGPPSFNEHDLSDKPSYIRRLGPLRPEQVRRVVRFRRAQLEAALAVDDAVRRILLALERRHMLGTTMVVFASDNGVAWGEHRLIAADKVVSYEEAIRVPLVIRYDPLGRERQLDDGHLTLNIDLAPTFAALAGTRMPGAEGRSLLPLLTRARQPHWRHDFLVEHLVGPPQRDVPTYCAVRGERYKYVLYQTQEDELYDLLLDPYELHNLASQPSVSAVKSRLRQRLATLCEPRPPGYTAFARRR
jgi:N-acetylglucosamine-6-sulfatase